MEGDRNRPPFWPGSTPFAGPLRRCQQALMDSPTAAVRSLGSGGSAPPQKIFPGGFFGGNRHGRKRGIRGMELESMSSIRQGGTEAPRRGTSAHDREQWTDYGNRGSNAKAMSLRWKPMVRPYHRALAAEPCRAFGGHVSLRAPSTRWVGEAGRQGSGPRRARVAQTMEGRNRANLQW